jgi:DNA-binding IclR family transcriptional regulator
VLAFLDKERRQLALNLWESRSGNRVPATFIKHLDHIRKTGYEQRASYLVSGVTNISFPVFDETGNTAAALTSPFLDRKEGTSSVRVAVEELRRAGRQNSVLR